MAPSRQEVLALLDLEHPLEFEAKALQDQMQAHRPRRTGQTTRMMVEAATDALNGTNVLLVGADAKHAEQLSSYVIALVDAVEGKRPDLCPDPPGIVRGAIGTAPTVKNRDEVCYVDHYQKNGDHRLLGPAGEIRTLEAIGDTYRAYDYDGNYLLDLDEDGKNQVMEVLGTRITFRSPKAGRISPPASQFTTVRVKSTGMVNTKKGVAPNVIDGVRLLHQDVVLLTDQPVPSKNGPYNVVMSLGKYDRNEVSLVRAGVEPTAGNVIIVQEGKTYGSTSWVFDGSVWTQLASTQAVSTKLPNGGDDIDTLIADISYTKGPTKKVAVASAPDSDAEERKVLADLLEGLLK
jgi:hypothetical protein